METLKILATVAAVSISVASFIIARLADSRSKKAEEVRNLLGDKESVAFGALKLLRDGFPKNSRDRKLVIAALMQACVFEGSNRARALLYRAIEQNLSKYHPEFASALRVVEATFISMDHYGFTQDELDLSRGKRRIRAVRKVLQSQPTA